MPKEIASIASYLFVGFFAGWAYFTVTLFSLASFWLQWRKTNPSHRLAILIVHLFRPTPYVVLLGVACLYWAFMGNPNYWFWVGFAVPVIPVFLNSYNAKKKENA